MNPYPNRNNPSGCETYASPASEKSCLIAKKFPFFSAKGIIVVLALLAGYYLFTTKWKKKK